MLCMLMLLLFELCTRGVGFGYGYVEERGAIGIKMMLLCSPIVGKIIVSYLWLSFYMLLYVGWCECVDGASWVFYSMC